MCIRDRLENMIEESEKYDVYDCFFFKDNACNDKASNMEWPWNFAVDDESIPVSYTHLTLPTSDLV